VGPPREDIEHELGLPIRKYMTPRNEADFYGATSIIAERCGFNPTHPPVARTSWVHFPIPDWVEPEVPLDLFTHRTFAVPKALRSVLVPTRNSQVFMREHGYHSAYAVGAPFIYALRYARPRIRGSRLVMPEHTLDYLTYSDQANSTVKKLIDFVLETRSSYDLTIFCLHPDDVRKGIWPNQLAKVKIPWVSGAESSDLNALRRLVALISQFEEVLINNLGSQIVYGWHFGCKVRFAGVGMMHNATSPTDTDFFRRHPLGAQARAIRNSSMSGPQLEAVAKEYGMVGRSLAPARYELLSSKALGLESAKPTEEIVDLLGWRTGSRTWFISKITTHDRLARKVVGNLRPKIIKPTITGMETGT
jgi:hypothetical protein